MSNHSTLTLRPATVADAAALHRLAALDSARDLSGDVLVADLDGRPVAALSLADGRAVADPFTYSAAALELLRARAAVRPSQAARGVRRLALSGAG